MCTRAIHLELVEDCTSESFIAAFHRFTARRGYCSDLLSDNGKYFIGADKELRKMFDESSVFAREVGAAMSSMRTTWHWNPLPLLISVGCGKLE